MLIKFSKQIANAFAEINNRCKSKFKTPSNIWDGPFSKMELFTKIIKNLKVLTIFAKTSILDVWQGPEYDSELASKVKDVSFLDQFEYQR